MAKASTVGFITVKICYHLYLLQDHFAEGKAVILTLKDQGVLDEGGDVLVNVNMIDDERYRKVINSEL